VDTILDLHGLRKVYEGFTLNDVSLTLPRGYIMGLVGPNGAGKTTVIKLVLGLIRRDAGTVRVCGLDTLAHATAVRSHIGFVHEAPAFYNHLTLATVASIVAPFYPRWDEPLFRRLASDFDLPLRKRVYSLSRGTKTRFALALAMAHHAELLLLDEPSTGLDPVFRRELLERLSAYIGDGTASVLFSTHITSDLDRIADYITLLRDGELIFSATKDEVLERWTLVKGGVELLDPDTRRLFKGIEVSDVSFAALTDDVQGVRCRFAGRDLVIEKASVEDVVFYLTRNPAGDGERSGATAADRAVPPAALRGNL
jgi:ABC-2 type transport system ATP-binding protein